MVLLKEPHISKDDECGDDCYDSDNGENCHDGHREENMMMGTMISTGKKIVINLTASKHMLIIMTPFSVTTENHMEPCIKIIF